MAAAVEVRALTKRYGTARGVEDLDFDVAHGEIFGFLGPNGARTIGRDWAAAET
jgi:ABC-2 type transport system ATP-binding protein